MATTYTSFITALAGITVSGVTRKYAINQTPPSSVATADLPAQFIWPGGGLEDGQRVMISGGFPVYSATLCILVEPVAQDQTPANYAKCVTLIDALDMALEAAEHGISGADCGVLQWTIGEEIRLLGKISYWCIIADVRTGGA